MKVLGTILIAITGLMTQMNVAPAATRADVFRGATSQPTAKSTKTNVARGAVSPNNVKSRVANASSTAEVPSNVVSRTVGKNTLVPIRVATDNVAQSGVKARATNVQSRTIAPKTSAATTRRSVANRTTLGRAAVTINSHSNSVGDNANYVKMVIIPEGLRTDARIAKYISLSGQGDGVMLLKKTNDALPNLGTFFGNMGLDGAYSDPEATDKVINSDGSIVSGKTIPNTLYTALMSVYDQLAAKVRSEYDIGVTEVEFNSNNTAALVHTSDEYCLYFFLVAEGNTLNATPVGMGDATDNQGPCSVTLEYVEAMHPVG